MTKSPTHARTISPAQPAAATPSATAAHTPATASATHSCSPLPDEVRAALIEALTKEDSTPPAAAHIYSETLPLTRGSNAFEKAAEFLQSVACSTACMVQQPYLTSDGYHSMHGETYEDATVVALQWPSRSGGEARGFACLTARSFEPGPNAPRYMERYSAKALHLYIVNEKRKPQEVYNVAFNRYDTSMSCEKTSGGIQELTRSVGRRELSTSAVATLLLSAAKASIGDAPARADIILLQEALTSAASRGIGVLASSRDAAAIGIQGVALLTWTPSATRTSARGKDVQAKTEATLAIVKAINDIAPPEEAAPRKKAFKMAKAMAPVESAADRSAGWGGDTGLFNDVSIEIFVKILMLLPAHSRLALTEFTCKSFRSLRFESELFDTLALQHTDQVKLASQLKYSSGSAIRCPASHFANLLQAKGSLVKSLSFAGGHTPLTAIKACLKVAGPQLTSLSLYGEKLPNPLTIAEVGKQCASLTYLDLSCGRFDTTEEEELIAAVKKMPKLAFLRVPPFAFGSFIGDLKFVQGGLMYKNAEMEQDNLEQEVNVDAHDFKTHTQDDFGPAGRWSALRLLQTALPSACKLTNNGSGGSMSWGQAKNDIVNAWHVWGCNSYKQMMHENMTATGSDGSTIVKGLVKTVFLQCGDGSKSGKRRFYSTREEWLAANPAEEPVVALGPVIHT